MSNISLSGADQGQIGSKSVAVLEQIQSTSEVDFSTSVAVLEQIWSRSVAVQLQICCVAADSLQPLAGGACNVHHYEYMSHLS